MNYGIPVMQPKLPKHRKVIPYLRSMDRRKVYSNNGYLLQTLEQRFAQMLGVDGDRVALCSSATLAIQGVCEITPVNEFKVPTFTFAATGLAIQKSGKDLELLDIDLNSWEVDISKTTINDSVGLVSVEPFGRTLNQQKYSTVKYHIIDAAASLGNYVNRPFTISKNQTLVFSLQATKVLGIGEGGLVLFGDSDSAREFRSWINFGFSGSRDSKIFGTNGKMSEIQAAYGHSALDGWMFEKKEWNEARKKVKKLDMKYSNIFSSYLSEEISPYWIIRAEESKILKIESCFKKNNIGTRRWWSHGLHKMPAFKNYARREFPNSDLVTSTSIGLPFFRGMTSKNLKKIDSVLAQI